MSEGYGWLTGHEIEKKVMEGKIIIEPFDSICLNPNSYNYHLDKRMMRLVDNCIDMRKEDNFEEFIIQNEGSILYPGECYLGVTKEIFGSDYFASLVTGRSSVGRKFITNHITAGLIDQGFHGRITLEITVQKPTIVYPNIVFGQIFWFSVMGESKLYHGKYQYQAEATISQIFRESGKDG